MVDRFVVKINQQAAVLLVDGHAVFGEIWPSNLNPDQFLNQLDSSVLRECTKIVGGHDVTCVKLA